MAAIVTHVSTRLVLRLDAGDEGNKRVTKRVTISGISDTASAGALWDAVKAVGALLEYKITAVELHTASSIEWCSEKGEGVLRKLAAAGLPTKRQPAPSYFNFIMPVISTFLPFTDFPCNALRPVLSRQSSIFACRGAAWVRHRAPPSSLAPHRSDRLFL